MSNDSNQTIAILAILALAMYVLSRRRWQGSRTAFGTARWASNDVLRRARMFAGRGLILGRTLKGRLIRLPTYCHTLIVASTGAGKGVSFIIPQLMTYFRSVICFDMKGDLFAVTKKIRKRMGQRVVRLAPLNGGSDSMNPFDAIPRDSPMLIENARAMAEDIVVRTGTENDPHWCDKSVQLITALIVLVLIRFEGSDRTLNSVQDIASHPKLLLAAAEMLKQLGGIPARMGYQIQALFVEGKGD